MEKHIALLQEAADKLAIYKQPDVEEAWELITSVFVAAGDHICADDQLENVEITSNGVSVTYEDSFHDDRYYLNLPRSIFDAADPVKAATKYRLEKELAQTEQLLGSLLNNVYAARARIEKLKAELTEVQDDETI